MTASSRRADLGARALVADPAAAGASRSSRASSAASPSGRGSAPSSCWRSCVSGSPTTTRSCATSCGRSLVPAPRAAARPRSSVRATTKVSSRSSSPDDVARVLVALLQGLNETAVSSSSTRRGGGSRSRPWRPARGLHRGPGTHPGLPARSLHAGRPGRAARVVRLSGHETAVPERTTHDAAIAHRAAHQELRQEQPRHRRRSTWRSGRARSSASSGPTGPARRPPSACCST